MEKEKERKVNKEPKSYSEKSYRIPKYSPEKHAEGVPPTERNPSAEDRDLSVIPRGNIIDRRNLGIRNIYENDQIQVSNVPNARIQRPDEAPKVEEMTFSPQQLRRLNYVIKETMQKVEDSLKSYNEDEEFDYWLFQSSLKMKNILQDREFLNARIKAAVEFEMIYGPINDNDERMKKLLRNFCGTANAIRELNRKMLLFSAFSTKYEKDTAEKMAKLGLSNLNFFETLPDFQSLGNNDQNRCIFNVNPITNRTHTEWFIIKRFSIPSDPSNLYIRHEKLEKLDEERGLVDYEKPPGTVIIEGLWPCLLDTTFTHHVRRFKDPCVDTKKVSTEKESKWRQNVWTSIYNEMRQAINMYTCGIECTFFFESLMYEEGFCPFGRTDNHEAVTKLPNVFMTSNLPGLKRMILFPAFMRGILPDGPYPVVSIIEQVWKRILLLVKLKGGMIRSMDLQNFYWSTWKKWLDVNEWGFSTNEKFVRWCMWYMPKLNPGGMKEGIVVQTVSGSSFLIYQQGTGNDGA